MMTMIYPIDDVFLQSTILELVTLTLHKKQNEIQLTTPLFASDDGFDSFGLMEFILRLEEAFNLSIPDEHLDPDIFYSVETIKGYLRQRLAGE
jgi:acyl carrier protein